MKKLHIKEYPDGAWIKLAVSDEHGKSLFIGIYEDELCICTDYEHALIPISLLGYKKFGFKLARLSFS